MSQASEMKRKFMVASGDEAQRTKLNELILKLYTYATVTQTKDGVEATFKIENDQPHVILIDPQLTKMSGLKLIEWVMNEKADSKIACILMGEIPEKEIFVEEVAMARVQFLDNALDEKKLSTFLARALNYSSGQKQASLKMRNIKSGELLIQEGSTAENVFILRAGQLEAYSEKIGLLGKIEPGEFVGEMSYINGDPRSASVKAVADSELVEIPIHLLDHVLLMKPAWAKALMKTLSKRIKIANQKK